MFVFCGSLGKKQVYSTVRDNLLIEFFNFPREDLEILGHGDGRMASGWYLC